ncbi:MAG: hypothetical protein ACAH08_01460 [Methylophilus sp.]|nr:hypothetical protein [Methylophilus sp.]HSH87262.1 hypothetical protein [Methylophilus sp.]
MRWPGIQSPVSWQYFPILVTAAQGTSFGMNDSHPPMTYAAISSMIQAV